MVIADEVIRITLKTKKQLDKLKVHKRQPYEEIIQQLLKEAKK